MFQLLNKIYPLQKSSIMKISFIGLAILFFAHPAFAQDSSFEWEGDFPIRGMNFCNQLGDTNFPFQSGPNTIDCLDITYGIELNVTEVRTCLDYTRVNKRLECLEIVAGTNLAPSVAQACGRIRSARKSLDCLEAIPEKDQDLPGAGVEMCLDIFYSQMSRYHNEAIRCLVAISGKNLSEAVVETCRDLSLVAIPHCLEVIAGKKLSKTGTAVCADMSRSRKKLRCLKIIAGKDLSDEEAERCKKAGSTERIMNCLRATVADPSRDLSQKERGLGEIISDFFKKIWAIF